jgi:purine nucleosidase
MRRFWIDTDTASDDAVAILMALRWPDVVVEGISVVAGNVPAEMGARNARYTVELCDQETPVYIGAQAPLLREPHWAYFFHGPDGMGGMNYPEARRPAEDKNGIHAMIDAIRSAPGEITLVTLGPLTNIALALQIAPEIALEIDRCYIMGGAACTVGNITPAAEYNIWFDPEAAQMVFQSGMPVFMVGWEHCRGEANLSAEDQAQVRAMNTKYADFVLDCNRQAIQTNIEWLGDPGLALPDPVTMAIALDPSICTQYSKHYVEVETRSELTRGMTVVDQMGVTKKPVNSDVCWAIDARRWKEALYQTIR